MRKSTTGSKLKQAMRGPLSRGRRFVAQEDGAMYILTIFFLVTMLVFSGLAIDFMKYELHRTRLQATLDRAILVAAHPDQENDRVDVVMDYFKRAGLGDTIKREDVIVDKDSNLNAVEASARLRVNTPFLSWSGVNYLEAPAAGRAEKGVSLTEISLVLDVSGSMGGSKLTALKGAAIKFSNLLLCDPSDADKYTDCTVPAPTSSGSGGAPISISLVPYAAYVNAGDEVLQAFNPIGAHNRNSCVTFSKQSFRKVGVAPTPPPEGLLLMTAVQKRDLLMHQSTAAMARSSRGNYQSRNSGAYREQVYEPDLTPCHTGSETWRQIAPLQHSAEQVRGLVNALQASGNTSIEVGLKWGTTLLHKAAQPVVEKLSETKPLLDGDGNPVLDADGNPLETSGLIHKVYKDRPFDPAIKSSRKIVVLMTDGQNTEALQMKPVTRSGESPIWTTNSGTKRWQDGRWRNARDGSVLSVYYPVRNQYRWHYVLRTNRYGTDVTDRIQAWSDHPFGTLPTDCLQRDRVRKICAGFKDPASKPRKLTYEQFWSEENYDVKFLEKQFPWLLTSDGSNRPINRDEEATYVVRRDDKNERLIQQCNAAKRNGMIIISIDMTSSGNYYMRRCASRASLDGSATRVLQYYKVSTTNIAATFSKLANDINKLRLTE
ncbi:Putative Flp pilus-assembly TadE/G-like [Aliiroseovarius halocynthiae]|nr:Putative Flp pilus-assembly TadE/G-like [Aliiroseovarius halocynthiae]